MEADKAEMEAEIALLKAFKEAALRTSASAKQVANAEVGSH